MFSRNIGILLALFLFSFFQLCCKKECPTSPIVQDETHPVIWIDTLNMSFTASTSGSNPSSQILKIKNSGVETLNYSISDDAEWLTCDPPNGSSSGNVVEHTVSINKSGLSEQDYSSTITVTCSEACNSPQKVQVSLKITKEPPPEIWVNTNQLTFSTQEGGSNPPSQTIKIKNNGEGTLNYQVTSDAFWLTVSPESGTSAGAEKSHSVSINIIGLSVGNYNGKLTISDPKASNSPQEVSISLNITKELPPEIWINTNSLTFQATVGGANPPSSTIYIKNSGEGTLSYSITWDAPWLNVSPNSGSSQGALKTHTVTVNIGGLSTGTYNGTITILDPNAANSPQQVAVTLQITSPLTDNQISISCSPTSGGTNTVVTLTVSIKGNIQEIKSFGFKINYDSTIFSFVSVSNGNITATWVVDGELTSPGIVKVGGYAGGTSPIPVGSSGSIAVIRLKVIYSGDPDGLKSQIAMTNLVDDVVGMIQNPSSVTFTYKK